MVTRQEFKSTQTTLGLRRGHSFTDVIAVNMNLPEWFIRQIPKNYSVEQICHVKTIRLSKSHIFEASYDIYGYDTSWIVGKHSIMKFVNV